MNEKLAISESNPIRARHFDYNHFTYPWHFHSQYEVMYVKESSGYCFAGDCIKEYSNDFLILFGSNLPHYMRSHDMYKTGDKSLRVKGTNIQFEKDFMLHSINHYPQFLPIKQLLEESRRGICFPLSVVKKISRLVEAIPDQNGMDQIMSFLSLLHQMSEAQRQQLASPLYYEDFPTLGNTRIEKILSFINGNYTRKLDLHEVSSMAAMNTSAFCRYFKENTGKTFLQYVTDMRIGYACKLLSFKEISIAQIAMDCGFESVSHFNRTFKNSTQYNPSDYQKKILA